MVYISLYDCPLNIYQIAGIQAIRVILKSAVNFNFIIINLANMFYYNLRTYY
jgi:hypothetical protein